MSKIKTIHAREVLDSRGNPTVEVEIYSDDGAFGKAIVPSGASTGIHEALELRDGDEKRYSGKGVLKAIANVNNEINEKLKGFEITDQKTLDETLIQLDGTENKGRLGANAILGVSLANAYCAANCQNKHLFEYLNPECKILPTPMMNIINGGVHADSGLEIQEFMIMPVGAKNFQEALRMGAEIFHHLKKILKDKNLSVGVGDEGGFAPHLPSIENALDIILEAIAKARYKSGDEVVLAMDCAASEFYKESKYQIKVNGQKENLSSAEITKYYENLISKYPIVSIEDPLQEDDWSGWTEINKALGNKIQIVTDDFTVTNTKRLKQAIDKKCGNAILIKLNQIGTLTETIEAINMAKQAGWNSVVSHRSGETEDSTIADLVVAMGTGQIKTGSLCRSERIAKYNQLLRIEEKLGEKAIYQGKFFKN
ncbi:MAG: Enolase, enolase [Candidatus Peregrinibacteria bacterium GW2011_GWF2_33_10]|nr:MAG: Enolase, enolase [Candidatus Peregrinibacteria bacterium GW2011_GWF2_33_10]OGJ43943.1 MAG: phosphopyruvate hydratase [Candidatus Peregrinibacteria bacterium RIFOXYA12_FULL_33_12]OGJ46024.1 MAG: phosphopyruvate hydratase [Candidatus Peregrinibacteria bacterium RIFOXYA2_FULL_33_21]OGJ51729.1 MAG: phosphopyruvate hydratase [Candidatus Peregrinibacteria bacterium RIFOXYB2_FULL_33_20]